MRLAMLFTLIVLISTQAAAPAQKKAKPKAPPAIDLKGKSIKQVFDELLPDLTKQAQQQQWQTICFQLSAPGNEALRTEACKLMAQKLGPQTPGAARVWLLLQLQRIGREECVDAVAAVLDDKDDLVRDSAVRCLANNPAPQATGKLLAKLPAASGKSKVGLINALAHRGDAAAVDAVAKELASADQAAAIAAARALGRFATPDAAKALAAARGKAKDELRLALTDAYLLCADRLVKDGKTAEALAIYKELNKPEEARPIRLAALQGVLRTSGDQAGPMIVEILAGNERDAQAIAIGQIENLSARALKPLAGNLEKLPPASQVLVLGAIAARGDKSLAPAALAAAKSSNDMVKRAGIQALGRLGDASVVPLLLDTLFASPNLSGAAAGSLAQLNADGVNEKLIAVLEAEKNSARIAALIGVLEQRKAASAVPALLKAARSSDPAVRASAFNGLKSLAEPKHVPEMVLALLKTEKGKEREQAELAIVAVSSQLAEPEKRAQPVLALLNDGAKGQQAALLPLLGRLGGPTALKVVKDALAGSNPELADAAVVALCNWPDAAVSDELLKIIPSAKAHRQAALAALIRVSAAGSDRPNEERLAALAALKKAMDLAASDAERKAILEGIGFVRHLDTLRYVVPYLDHKELNQPACKAVVELAHSRIIREPNQAEFNKALDRVIAICKDKTLLDRAKQYKQAP